MPTREPALGSEPAGRTYLMRPLAMAAGDDFWIEDRAGVRAWLVDGAAAPSRSIVSLRDPGGAEIYRIDDRRVRVRDMLEIESDTGTVATVRKTLVTPLRERFDVSLSTGAQWSAQGSIGEHEYRVDGPDGRVAEVSRRWVVDASAYGVEVLSCPDAALAVMVVVAIDRLTRPTA